MSKVDHCKITEYAASCEQLKCIWSCEAKKYTVYVHET